MGRRSPSAPAVVFGDLELIHALGRAGIPSVAVGPPGSNVRLSRFVHEVIDAPPARLLATAGDDLVDALLGYAAAAPAPPIVLCDSDEALEFLSEHRGRLEPALRLPIPAREALLDLTDKWRFQSLADRCGLPVPRTQIVSAAAGQAPDDVDLRFPVVLKPFPHRDARWTAVAGAEKALRVCSQAELRTLWPSLAAAGIEAVVQELVPGEEERIVSYHVYVDGEGEVAGEFTGRKIRTLPREFGASTSLTTTDDPEVAALGREVVGRIGFRGVAKVDFKRGPDGVLHLLELNPRFTLWVHAGAVAGVNLPAIVYSDLAGLPRPEPARARPGVRWVSLHADLAAARAHGISLARWAVFAAGCETNSAFAWSDMGPLVRRLGRAASARVWATR